VTYPASTEDVVKIVKIANKYHMPITPYSGGTALEGHTTGYKAGGICVDVSVNMNKILEVHGTLSFLISDPPLPMPTYIAGRTGLRRNMSAWGRLDGTE
jgi:D-lactate dehydrogenase (cytochrome)